MAEVNFEPIQDDEKRTYDLLFRLEIDAKSELRGKDLIEAVEGAVRAVGAEPIMAQAREFTPQDKAKEAEDDQQV